MRLLGVVGPNSNPCTGDARIIVGDYVGVEYYCNAVLQKSRKKDMTPAVCGLFGVFACHESLHSVTSNSLRDLPIDLVNEALSHRAFRLSSDQVKVVIRASSQLQGTNQTGQLACRT